MHRYLTGACVAAAAGVALSTIGVTGAGVSGAVTRAVSLFSVPAVRSGTQLWARRYNGLSGSSNYANAVAASPTGKEVFVTGKSSGKNSYFDYATVAYSASTGKQLWVQRRGIGYGSVPVSLAVSPGGGTVYVTGYDEGTDGHDAWATVAYRASTGKQLWIKSYHSGYGFGAQARSVAASPTGKQVFVTGWSTTSSFGQQQYTTVAYSASTGRQLWIRNYSVCSGCGSTAASVAVGPSGGAVYVTGGGNTGTGNIYYATVAYSASTGKRLWARIYAAGGETGAISVAATRSEVFATGSDYSGTFYKYATVAYSASTGKQLWAKIYGRGSYDQAYSLAVSPTGKEVVVTGRSSLNPNYGYQWATVAYSASTGKQLWAKIYGTGDLAYEAAFSPVGGRVYVTGGAKSDTEYATVAYDAVTGRQLWAKDYSGPVSPFGQTDDATSLAVGPGGTVFVTGDSESDYATIAYKG